MSETRPTGLQAFPGGAGEPIARLNSLEGFTRALLVGVIPLLVLEALGSKEQVTRAYLLASILTLTITLNFATLERLLQRRWVVTLGAGFTLAATLIFIFGEGMVIAFGIGFQAVSASLFSVCISLYIMDYIGKKQLLYTESRRLLYTGMAWTIGPLLGLWMWENLSPWSPFVLAALSAMSMLSFFWYLRLGRNEIIQPARKHSSGLLKIVPRFFSQPMMRVAYAITIARAIFWVSLFIFGPIYVVEAGLPVWIAGALLSFVSGLLMASPWIRDLAKRFGTRLMIIYGLSLTAGSMVGLFFIGEAQSIGLLFWVLASLGGVIVDVLCNIPFMRMVKPRERTEMTMIFSTWREGSQLLTPLMAAAVLLILPFKAYYLLLALILFAAALMATKLPRRL